MLAQPQLPLPRPAVVRLRSVRRPFSPSTRPGPYKLPHDAQGRLTTALQGFRNRESAFALAVFLGRYWSAPGRLDTAFPIDRRALTDHPELGLTEAQVRGAIRTLERVGFLDREIAKGSTHKLTAAGELHRRPILYVFGHDYAPVFRAANNHARAARERQGGAARPAAPDSVRRPCAPSPAGPLTRSPKDSEAKTNVLMGEKQPALATPSARPTSNAALEAAIARFARAIGGAPAV